MESAWGYIYLTIYAPGFRVGGPPPGASVHFAPLCPDAPPGCEQVRLLSARGALDDAAPEPLERQRSTTTGGRRALDEDRPQDLEHQRPTTTPQPQGGRRALDEDRPQDLERQRSTTTGGGGTLTRIPLRIWSASARRRCPRAGRARDLSSSSPASAQPPPTMTIHTPGAPELAQRQEGA